MPIPTPKANEAKKKFIARCMNDSVMKKEFPDQVQRSAVCNQAWDKKHALLVDYLRARGWTDCQITVEIRRIEQRV